MYNNNSLKVSIIIPIYRVEPYIVRCIDSVLSQTYRDLEVILVDDCSPDSSMKLAKECVDKSQLSKDIIFVYLYHDYNRGLSAARNTGVVAATGDYIYFLDSDDELFPNCISILVNSLQNEKYDFVIGNYMPINSKIPLPKLELRDGVYYEKEIKELRSLDRWYVMAWNKLCRRAFVLDNQLFFLEGLVHEDDLWSFQLACVAQSMYVCSDITYKYYLRDSSITGSANCALHYNTFNIILNEMREFQNSRGLQENKYINIMVAKTHKKVKDLARSAIDEDIQLYPLHLFKWIFIGHSYGLDILTLFRMFHSSIRSRLLQFL